jgi:hypothetical protein
MRKKDLDKIEKLFVKALLGKEDDDMSATKLEIIRKVLAENGRTVAIPEKGDVNKVLSSPDPLEGREEKEVSVIVPFPQQATSRK